MSECGMHSMVLYCISCLWCENYVSHIIYISTYNTYLLPISISLILFLPLFLSIYPSFLSLYNKCYRIGHGIESETESRRKD